jgi:hypothetical protein
LACGINRQPQIKCESDLDQLKGQLTLILVLVPFDKIRNRSGQFAHLQIAATAQLAGDVVGNIFPTIANGSRWPFGLGSDTNFVGRNSKAGVL